MLPPIAQRQKKLLELVQTLCEGAKTRQNAPLGRLLRPGPIVRAPFLARVIATKRANRALTLLMLKHGHKRQEPEKPSMRPLHSDGNVVPPQFRESLSKLIEIEQ